MNNCLPRGFNEMWCCILQTVHEAVKIMVETLSSITARSFFVIHFIYIFKFPQYILLMAFIEIE